MAPEQLQPPNRLQRAAKATVRVLKEIGTKLTELNSIKIEEPKVEEPPPKWIDLNDSSDDRIQYEHNGGYHRGQ